MGFELRQNPSGLETVNEFTGRMKSTTEEAKSAIHKAQEDMARYYNQRRSPTPVFKPGDQVYLDTVTPYKCLGKISGDLHSNNQNNQLERRAQLS